MLLVAFVFNLRKHGDGLENSKKKKKKEYSKILIFKPPPPNVLFVHFGKWLTIWMTLIEMFKKQLITL